MAGGGRLAGGAGRAAGPVRPAVRARRAARAGRALPGGAARPGRAQERLAARGGDRRRAGVAHAAGAQPRAVGRGGGARPLSRARGRAPGRRGRGAGRRRERLREEGPPLGRRGATVLRHRGQGRELPGRRLPGLRQPRGARPDRSPALPAGEAWAGDAERRRAAKVPEDVPFLTEPAIARAMLARALDAGVPCGWVPGDEVYGADRRLRAMLEERGKPYLLTVRGNDALEAELDGGVGRHEAAVLARALPPRAWRRLSAGAGTKGERLYDWARGRLLPPPDGGGDAPPRERWLLVRRSIADPADLAYFVVFAPAGLRLARVAGRRWPVGECFEAAEQEVGLADYEVRSWRGWHRHVTLAMLALALLAGLRAGLNGLKGAQGPPASSSCRSASPRSAA